MELQANTASSLLFTLNDTTGWTGVQHATWSLTSSFQTFTFTANAFSNGHMSFHFNLTPPGFPTAATGTVNMRNLRVYTQSTSVTISTNTNITGQLNVNGSAVQEAISGFSQGTTYLYGPTHMPTPMLGNSTWTNNNNGTATITLGGTGQNHYTHTSSH